MEKTIKRNKELIEKYPFLAPRGLNGKVLKDFKWTHNDFELGMPQGWWKSWGLIYCQDLKDVCERNNVDLNSIYSIQVKEKYGGLRNYLNQYPEEWLSHEFAWEYISEHTCVKCGKFPVKMRDDGWVSPWCDECFKENHNNLSEEDFAKYSEKWTIDKDDRLQEYLVINHFSKDGDYQEWIDMKPYYNKLGWKYTDKDLILKDELEKLMEEKANAK